MSPPQDPLLETEAPDRLHYATGVLLDAGDMVAEQTYHRGRLARALAYLHGVGTVAGLRAGHIDHDAAVLKGEVSVKPGLAVDPLGRLVELPRMACLRVKPWYESHDKTRLPRWSPALYNVGAEVTAHPLLPAAAVVADLFLRFYTGERGRTPAFVQGPWEALDATVPSRLRDGYELRLVPRTTPPPKVPAPPWPLPPGGTPWPDTAEPDVTKRRIALREAILSAWHEGKSDPEGNPGVVDALLNDSFLPAELKYTGGPPQTQEPDPTWIFLARVLVGVDATQNETGPDGQPRPLRTGTVLVDNTQRPLCMTVGALARWLGL